MIDLLACPDSCVSHSSFGSVSYRPRHSAGLGLALHLWQIEQLTWQAPNSVAISVRLAHLLLISHARNYRL